MDTAVEPGPPTPPAVAPVPAAALPLATACAVVVAVVAGLVLLLGWAAAIEPLKRIQPGWVAMNPTTALLFLLAAAVLWLQAGSQRADPSAGGRRTALALAGLVSVAGATKLGEHLGLAVPAIDQWLFTLQLAPDAERGFARNEMAPNTAVAFLLAGMALALLDPARAPAAGRPNGWRPGRR